MVTFGRAKTYATPATGLVTNDGTKPTSKPSPIRRSNGFKVDRYDDIRPTEKR